jgi:hypothetical protein
MLRLYRERQAAQLVSGPESCPGPASEFLSPRPNAGEGPGVRGPLRSPLVSRPVKYSVRTGLQQTDCFTTKTPRHKELLISWCLRALMVRSPLRSRPVPLTKVSGPGVPSRSCPNLSPSPSPLGEGRGEGQYLGPWTRLRRIFDLGPKKGYLHSATESRLIQAQFSRNPRLTPRISNKWTAARDPEFEPRQGATEHSPGCSTLGHADRKKPPKPR